MTGYVRDCDEKIVISAEKYKYPDSSDMYLFPGEEIEISEEKREEIQIIGLENLNVIDEEIDFERVCSLRNQIARGTHCGIYHVENENRVFRKAEISNWRYHTEDSFIKYHIVSKNFLAIEQKLLESLDHPNIIKPIGICSHNDEYYQILPYYTPISTWITNNQITKNHIVKWTWQLFSVLNYLEENQIIHRDIRTSNLLLMMKKISFLLILIVLKESQILIQ